MGQTWKRTRRNLKAKAAFALQPGLKRSDIRSFLASLVPYRTNVPLIRLGGENDGGYLVPDDLEGIVACFSPGVSETMTFDLDVMGRGIPSYMADASVEGLVEQHPLATFDPLFVGPRSEGNVISLDDWVARYAPAQGDLMLQMDIEGAEYETLAATSPETLSRFRIIVLELHSLNKVFRKRRLARYKRMMDALAEHFVVVHTHPNNCAPMVSAAGFDVPPVLELTLLRRDRVQESAIQTELPHPLDECNVPDLPDYSLPRAWFSYPDRDRSR